MLPHVHAECPLEHKGVCIRVCVFTGEFEKFSGGRGDGGEEEKETKSRGERKGLFSL